MKNVPTLRDFTFSIIFGYLLIFVVVIPLLSTLFNQQEVVHGLYFALFSLIFGLPVAISAIVFGFPVFKILFTCLPNHRFLGFMVGWLSTILVSVFIVALLNVLLLNETFNNISGNITFLGLPAIVVAVPSGFILWLRMR